MIRLNRKQSILSVLVLITTFVLFSFIFFSTNKSQVIIRNKNMQADDAAEFTLKNFHRSEIKNGVKLWEVTAKKGAYNPDTGVAELKQPVLIVYRDNEEIEIIADQAEIIIAGESLNYAKLMSNVSIKLDNGVSIKTEEANYLAKEKKVISKSAITIINENSIITGVGLNANLETRDFTILSNVKSIIKNEIKKDA